MRQRHALQSFRILKKALVGLLNSGAEVSCSVACNGIPRFAVVIVFHRQKRSSLSSLARFERDKALPCGSHPSAY